MRVKWALLLALLLSGASVHAERWTFGLIGDVPYSDWERKELPLMLESMATQGVVLIAHIGDIKSGKRHCDNALYLDRKTVFDAAAVPLIYVPGDNEWIDCGRFSNGAYEPLERLAYLRRVFYPSALSLGKQPMAVERQSEVFPEHQRFRLGPVWFVALNIPGGNNNFGPKPGGSDEFRSRNAAAIAWLRAGFERARSSRAPGIVILMQANPYFEYFDKKLPYTGYRDLLNTLREETQRFPGQVLVVHGDTHWSRIDHPLQDAKGKTLPNFTRVETFGYPTMGWTRGMIDTEGPDLFRFETHPWYGAKHAEPFR